MVSVILNGIKYVKNNVIPRIIRNIFYNNPYIEYPLLSQVPWRRRFARFYEGLFRESLEVGAFLTELWNMAEPEIEEKQII